MCRRKLATLRSQKESGAVAPPTGGAGQLGVKIDGGDRISGTGKVSREARELEAALEETKVRLVLVLAGRITFAFHTCKIQFRRSSYVEGLRNIYYFGSLSCLHDKTLS